jgi:dephospho-CoA kinase
VKKGAKKKIIGILGGIWSGKSTVANQFARLGCGVIDADNIAHEMLDNEKIKKRIVKLFGDSILNKDGKIDHRKLADIVFTDAGKLKELNGIIHPAVLNRIEKLIKEYSRQPEVKAIVLDIPLLLEAGWEKRCDSLVFVNCSREKRVERAEKTGLFDENQLKIRENFQISLDKKADIAENIIDNNNDLDSLIKQVAEIFTNIIVSR